MRFADALAELDARQPEHMPKPDLERIRALADLLDSPQLTYPTIHVTGTNGKTTTARLAERIACAHGLTTGLFTSPHLRSVTERFQLCGRPIAEGEFGREYEHLLPYLRTVDERVGRVTYFEALVALAFLWFADKPVALGVFEVGMGGTWDATNLVAGDVAVICPVGLDHPELGSTRGGGRRGEGGDREGGPDRRRPGAGGRGPRGDRGAERRRRRPPAARGAGLGARDADPGVRRAGAAGSAGCTRRTRTCCSRSSASSRPTARRPRSSRPRPCSSAPLEEEAVREALEGATSPGRLEVVGRRPLVVLDGAHNPAAAEALVAALPEAFTWGRLHLVVAVFSNKDLDGIADALAPLADAGYAATTDSVRARPTQEIERALSSRGVATQGFPGVHAALDAARAAAAPEDLILVTGSLYTVAAAREALVKGSPS